MMNITSSYSGRRQRRLCSMLRFHVIILLTIMVCRFLSEYLPLPTNPYPLAKGFKTRIPLWSLEDKTILCILRLFQNCPYFPWNMKIWFPQNLSIGIMHSKGTLFSRLPGEFRLSSPSSPLRYRDGMEVLSSFYQGRR